MDSNNPSVLQPITRATGYAVTSLFAHAAGYFLQASPRKAPDAFLVLALWVTSLPFFLSYANSYHSEDPLGFDDDVALRWAKSNAVKILPIGVVLSTALLLVTYRALGSSWPASAFWQFLAIFAIGFSAYAWYTVKQAAAGPSIMRHQLVWPVVFSIALPLYSGIIFSPAGGQLLIFAPILGLLAYFFISLRFRRWVFASTGVFLLFSIITIRILGYDGRLAQFSAMAFYLCIAAYLAVFEAWGITAGLALQEARLPSGSDSEGPHLLRTTRYFLASFVALSVAALTLPMVYVFSDFGRIFFWGTSAHVLAAFLVWFWAGQDLGKLAPLRGRWLWSKTFAGFFFLVVLVGDAIFRDMPTSRALVNLKSLGSLSVSIAISILAVTSRYKWDKEQSQRNLGEDMELLDWVKRLPMSRAGVIVVAIIMSLMMALFSLIVEGLQAGSNLFLLKSDRSFFFYLLAALVSSILLAFFKGGARISFPPVLGLLLSARWFTSVVIGLAVFLPARRSGAGLDVSLFSALPFLLASAGGFMLNDACDYERDSISKPFRPIPRGLVDRNVVRLAGLFTILLAVAAMLLAPTSILGQASQAAAIAGVVLYNFLTAKWGWIKGPFTAMLCVLPLVFVIDAFGYPRGFWWLIAAAYAFCVGRELLMDTLDLEGDQATGFKTVPIILGVEITEWLAMTFVALAGLSLSLLSYFTEELIVRGAVGVALAALVLLIVIWIGAGDQSLKRQVIRLSWLPMMLALSTLLG